MSTYAGQNLGAQKFDRIKQGILLGTAISVLYGIAASISLIAFGRTLSLMFIDSSETEVLNASVQYAASIGIFYWVLGILNVVRPSLQGLGFTSRAIFSGVIEMFARCTVSFGLVPVIGYKAVWNLFLKKSRLCVGKCRNLCFNNNGLVPVKNKKSARLCLLE